MHAARTPLSILDGRNFATVPEAAAVLRCDPRTIRSRIAEGEIPAIRAGSQYPRSRGLAASHCPG